MRNAKKVIIIVLILMSNLIVCDLCFSQQMRNPFKDWLPRKAKEEPKAEAVEGPIAIVEVKHFDPSIYTVEGLFWGAQKPKAIINGTIYSLGDMLDEAKIVDINKEGVTLFFNDENYVISTKPVINIKNTDTDSSKQEDQGVGNEP